MVSTCWYVLVVTPNPVFAPLFMLSFTSLLAVCIPFDIFAFCANMIKICWKILSKQFFSPYCIIAIVLIPTHAVSMVSSQLCKKIDDRHIIRGSCPQNVIFSNGPDTTSGCSYPLCYSVWIRYPVSLLKKMTQTNPLGASNTKMGILVWKVLVFLLVFRQFATLRDWTECIYRHCITIFLCQFDKIVNKNRFLTTGAYSSTFTYYLMLELLSLPLLSYSSISESKSYLLVLLLPSSL